MHVVCLGETNMHEILVPEVIGKWGDGMVQCLEVDSVGLWCYCYWTFRLYYQQVVLCVCCPPTISMAV